MDADRELRSTPAWGFLQEVAEDAESWVLSSEGRSLACAQFAPIRAPKVEEASRLFSNPPAARRRCHSGSEPSPFRFRVFRVFRGPTMSGLSVNRFHFSVLDFRGNLRSSAFRVHSCDSWAKIRIPGSRFRRLHPRPSAPFAGKSVVKLDRGEWAFVRPLTIDDSIIGSSPDRRAPNCPAGPLQPELARAARRERTNAMLRSIASM